MDPVKHRESLRDTGARTPRDPDADARLQERVERFASRWNRERVSLDQAAFWGWQHTDAVTG